MLKNKKNNNSNKISNDDIILDLISQTRDMNNIIKHQKVRINNIITQIHIDKEFNKNVFDMINEKLESNKKIQITLCLIMIVLLLELMYLLCRGG